MNKKILHLLSQRPSRTGSGVTLDSIVRLAKLNGWQQRVVVGTPREDSHPEVGTLPAEQISPLLFEQGELDFPVPGMSDVMPYRSTVWSTMTKEQLAQYEKSWRRHLNNILQDFEPDIIHCHHIWLLSSLVKDLAPNIPVVNHCHATGLRQMKLCPHLKERVIKGCRRNERFLVLHNEHAHQLTETLNVAASRVQTIGAGFRQDIFHQNNKGQGRRGQICYAGKYSRSKGLPWLLDAFAVVRKTNPQALLHIAGTGSGHEAETIKERMEKMDGVVLHGQLSQGELADLLARCELFVLPSFYEGLPLVLIEALACGCRLICTRLSGVEEQLAPHLAQVLELVDLPPLKGVDEPAPEGEGPFVERLVQSINGSLVKGAVEDVSAFVQPFTWQAVFAKMEEQWKDLISTN